MFTGLVEEVATVRRIQPSQGALRLELQAQKVLADLRQGDSVSVNGVCLTVTAVESGAFAADAVPETMRRTNLGRLAPGDGVNLERALQVADRFGGHIVSGHVDGTGTLRSRVPDGNAVVLTVATPDQLLKYIAEKGSVCVDGVSLTVMDVACDSFRVAVIPHTAVATTLLRLSTGAVVNLECDVIAKYVERLLGAAGVAATDTRLGSRNISQEWLRTQGF